MWVAMDSCQVEGVIKVELILTQMERFVAPI